MTGASSLQRRLTGLFVVTGLVTVVLAVATVSSLLQLNRATHDRVDVYGPALLDSEALAGAYSDQETGIRGFVTARDRDFLQPYVDGRRSERRSLRHLRRVLRDRPDLLGLVGPVESAARAWRQQVAAPAIERAGNRSGSIRQTLDQIQQGKELFDRIRAALADLQAPVGVERARAASELHEGQRRLHGILLVVLLGLITLSVATFVALRRWVTRPLARLGAEVDLVEGGDLEHQVAVPGAPQEIGVLAGQVDRMRSRVVANASLAERARAEAAEARALVEEQAVDLRRSNTELEQFAYVASHDLQEPLRKVASFCQLIERRYKGQLDERGDQYIEFAVDGAKRMQQLIQDLLMFSRVGRRSSGFQETDLEQVFTQAVRQLGSALEESAAVVSHDPLPTVEGDPSLLAQLFQNLIGNGVKFRGAAPPRVHLSASPSSTPGVWAFACTDNGIGVEAQYADKIFVIFQRLHGRDAYAGTGIGLAMCKKIVEHHGGRMWLDATPRDTPGAVFRWTLPERQADAEQAADGPSSADNEQDEHGEQSRSETIRTREKERSPDDATVRG